MLWGIYSAIYGEVNVSVEKCVEIKGGLCWKIAKFFYFCHLKKLVRPETFGPYYVFINLFTILVNTIKFQTAQNNFNTCCTYVTQGNTVKTQTAHRNLMGCSITAPPHVLSPNNILPPTSSHCAYEKCGARLNNVTNWISVQDVIRCPHRTVIRWIPGGCMSGCSGKKGTFRQVFL